MFHVAILSTNEISQFIRQVIDSPYKKMMENHGMEPIRTVAFLRTFEPADDIVEGIPAITINQFLSFYKMGMIRVVIFPREISAYLIGGMYL